MSNGIRPQKWKFTQFSVEWSALSGGHGWPFEFLKFSWMVLFGEKQSYTCYQIVSVSVLNIDHSSTVKDFSWHPVDLTPYYIILKI